MTWLDDVKEYVIQALAVQIDEEAPQAEQPPWIRVPMRPHQLTLLAAAKELEAKASLSQIDIETPQLLTQYGVLADRVGAGKSLVALGLVRDPPVAHSQCHVRSSGAAKVISLTHMAPVREFDPAWASLSNDAVATQMKSEAGGKIYTKVALCVVPHTVTLQWDSYIREHTDLRAVVIKKTKDCDYDHPEFLREIFTADIVVVSCTMLRKFMGALGWYFGNFSRIVWSRLFIDEADSIMCALRRESVRARFYWFITGSWLNMLFPGGAPRVVESLPPDLQVALGAGAIAGLRSRQNLIAEMVADVYESPFQRLILRNRNDWIEKSLAAPVLVHETIRCAAPPNVGILRDFISPAALEALHAGDIAGAMTALGLKATKKESLVARVTASLQIDLVEAEKLLAFKREMLFSTPAAKAQAIERAEAKVARIQGQLQSLAARIEEATATALCPICYDAPKSATLTPCCRQTFCLSCLCECIAKNAACPLCRQKIGSVKDLLVIGEEEVTGSGDVTGLPTKGAALLKLLSESTADDRILVFSAHEASFKGLRDVLNARGIRAEMLAGSSMHIERVRKQFRSGAIRVLCMNARHVGSGLNLEAATHVILYHRMNTELEKQVIGRAIRFERATELRVMHLVHEHETGYTGSAGSEVIVHV
jgi:hypothetical protein